MPQTKLLQALMQQATAGGSRSTALKPLGWLLGMLLSTSVTSSFIKAPEWLTLTFVALTVLSFLIYIGAYIFLLLRDRDALRSEKFSLQKLAIQHSLVGDSETGLFNLDDKGDVPLLPGKSLGTGDNT